MFTGIVEEVGAHYSHRTARRKSADHRDRRAYSERITDRQQRVRKRSVSHCSRYQAEIILRRSRTRDLETHLVLAYSRRCAGKSRTAHEGRRTLRRPHRAGTRRRSRQADRFSNASPNRRTGGYTLNFRIYVEKYTVYKGSISIGRGHQPHGCKSREESLRHRHHSAHGGDDQSAFPEARRSGQPGNAT